MKNNTLVFAIFFINLLIYSCCPPSPLDSVTVHHHEGYYAGIIYLNPSIDGETGIIRMLDASDPIEKIDEIVPGISFQLPNSETLILEKGDTVFFKISQYENGPYFATALTKARPNEVIELTQQFIKFSINLHDLCYDHGGQSHNAGHIRPLGRNNTTMTRETKTLTLCEIDFNNSPKFDTIWLDINLLNLEVDYFIDGKVGKEIIDPATGKTYFEYLVRPHIH